MWVADFTYVATWSGTVYVAFVIDCHSRRILGWRAATSMRTELVLDALEQAIWTCIREGVSDLAGLVCHHDAGSQYTSIAFTERLAAAGAESRWWTGTISPARSPHGGVFPGDDIPSGCWPAASRPSKSSFPASLGN